jgi:uncharacterized peroxidase-related enzyme
MAWIKRVKPEAAQGLLKTLYDAVRTPDGHIDNILQIHSVRPRTLKGHLELYKAALHSKPNALSPRERELVGVTVSYTNECKYCVDHHTAGLAKHVGSQALAEELVKAAVGIDASDAITEREIAMCAYARKLTAEPAAMLETDLDGMRAEGLEDEAILDVNQVAAYFAYANRTVNGLGVEIAGEPLGFHPDENEEGFGHK